MPSCVFLLSFVVIMRISAQEKAQSIQELSNVIFVYILSFFQLCDLNVYYSTVVILESSHVLFCFVFYRFRALCQNAYFTKEQTIIVQIKAILKLIFYFFRSVVIMRITPHGNNLSQNRVIERYICFCILSFFLALWL